MKHAHIDEQWAQYTKKYPKFPGVQKCVELLTSSFLRGTRVDFVAHMMEKHASTHTEEFIDAYWQTADERLRAIIAGVLSEEAIDDTDVFFWEVLCSNSKDSWSYAIYGLKQLNTKKARTLLWQAQTLHPHNDDYQNLFITSKR